MYQCGDPKEDIQVVQFVCCGLRELCVEMIGSQSKIDIHRCPSRERMLQELMMADQCSATKICSANLFIINYLHNRLVPCKPQPSG